MARDGRLGLGEKLALAAIEKGRGNQKEAAIDPELRHLPKGKVENPSFLFPGTGFAFICIITDDAPACGNYKLNWCLAR